MFQKLIAIARKKPLLIAVGAAGVLIVILLYVFLMSAPGGNAETERFVVPLNASERDVAKSLRDEGFIRSAFMFTLIHRGRIEPGGYHLTHTMSVFKISHVFSAPAYMTWVVIPEGATKAQIATLLTDSLGWTDRQKDEFIATNVRAAAPLTEGVYFPDTYLLPKGEAVAAIIERIFDKFNEKFAPYAEEALKQDMKWTTLIRFASLVQAEAAGEKDMPLIAGILWNRLSDGMRLQVDVASSTYRTEGLPAQPVNNPGLGAMDAVLNPEKTDCFYYIHDKSGAIHCAVTFAEHKANIKRYLQ